MAGSPMSVKRISLPSTSTASASPGPLTPSPSAASGSKRGSSSISYASPAKRLKESSPNVSVRSISPEKSLTSILKDSTRTLLSVTPKAASLVQSLRDRMPKITPEQASLDINQSKRFSTATTVALSMSPKSPVNLAGPSGAPGRGQLVTSTPAQGHRSSILIRGSSGPFTSSPPPKSQPSKSPNTSGRSKNLSVTFSDVLITPGFSPSSSKLQAHSMTPENEKTSFDFSAVKTPNVPREMYVSSILSSSSRSASVKATGSAKRKARSTGPRDSLTPFADRRAGRAPPSPRGYVDVKGIKRLTTEPIKSPTYLAVEGVKRLFGEARAHASDGYTSFSGVRELFASPPLARNRSPDKSLSVRSSAPSPVAKIQAQVEQRNWSAPISASPSRPATSSPPRQEPSSRSPAPRSPRTSIMSPLEVQPFTKKPGPKSKTMSPYIDGVKRLFGAAKAQSSSSYASVSGVRELFASPSPAKSRPASAPSPSRDAPAASSPGPAEAPRSTRGSVTTIASPPGKKPGPKSKTLGKSPTRVESAAKPAAESKELESKTKKPAAKSKAESPAKKEPEKTSPQKVQPRTRRNVTFDLPEVSHYERTFFTVEVHMACAR